MIRKIPFTKSFVQGWRAGLGLAFVVVVVSTIPAAAKEICWTEGPSQFAEATHFCVSSVLPPQGKFDYGPKNLVDYFGSTGAWCEGAHGNGIGEAITIRIDGGPAFRRLGFKNGYSKSAKSFADNGRIKTLRITSDTGINSTVQLIDQPGEQPVYLPLIAPHRWVRLEILDVYPGERFADTCVSGVGPDFIYEEELLQNKQATEPNVAAPEPGAALALSEPPIGGEPLEELPELRNQPPEPSIGGRASPEREAEPAQRATVTGRGRRAAEPPSGAKAATPDASTVASTQGVTLCRSQGTRCFIPEAEDPIFIGDVITTTSSGRLELNVPGSDRSTATSIFVFPRSKIRIDRNTTHDFVKVEMLGGAIGVEPPNDRAFDVSFDSMICTVDSGRVAIGYNMPGAQIGSASVSNVSATCRCLSEAGGDYEVPRNTVVSFKDGGRMSQEPLAEGFWSNLIQAR